MNKKRKNRKIIEKVSQEKVRKTDKKEEVQQEKDDEPIELGKDFYKIPLIVAAVITILFYIFVFIFVK